MPSFAALVLAILTVPLGIYGIITWIRASAGKYGEEIRDPVTKELIGRRKTWWTFLSANMDASVTNHQNRVKHGKGTGTLVQSGGEIVDWIHGVPGKRIVKPSSDQMSWYMENGKQSWGFIRDFVHFATGGAYFLGPFRDLRLNTLHEFRFTKGKGDPSYEIDSRDYDTLWVYHSGALAVMVREAETKGTFTVDLDLNIIYTRKYFIRSLLKVADANSVLTIMAEAKVTGILGPLKPEDVVAGTEAVKQEITKDVISISPRSEEQIGMELDDVEFYNFDMPDKERELMELAERTRREQEARIQVAETDKAIAIIAQDARSAVQVKQADTDKVTKVTEATADKEARMQANLAEEDRITRVVKPASETPEMAAIYRTELMAQAFTDNETVTVFAPGGNTLAQMLPSELIVGKSKKPEPAGAGTP